MESLRMMNYFYFTIEKLSIFTYYRIIGYYICLFIFPYNKKDQMKINIRIKESYND